MKYYKARWGVLLIVMSTLLTALCLGQATAEFWRHGASAWLGWMLRGAGGGLRASSIAATRLRPMRS